MLPKIEHPTFTITLFSNKKKITFRPFTVKEEKILLIAKMSDDITDIINAIKQIISNCVLNKDFNIDDCAMFDIEKLFIAIRSKSVNNIIELVFADKEDKLEYTVPVDLDKIEVVVDKDHKTLIKVDDKISIKMKYPTYGLLYKLNESIDLLNQSETENNVKSEELLNKIFMIYAECIDKIINDQSMYINGKDFDVEEAIEFLNQLPQQAVMEIKNFFSTQPKIQTEVSYTNKLGNVKSHTLKGISDFFT